METFAKFYNTYEICIHYIRIALELNGFIIFLVSVGLRFLFYCFSTVYSVYVDKKCMAWLINPERHSLLQ